MSSIGESSNFYGDYIITHQYEVHTSMPPDPPKLLRCQCDEAIHNSLVDCKIKKASIISGYHYGGTIWAVKYADDKLLYYTLKIPEIFGDNYDIDRIDADKLILYAIENNKVEDVDTYVISPKN